MSLSLLQTGLFSLSRLPDLGFQSQPLSNKYSLTSDIFGCACQAQNDPSPSRDFMHIPG